MRIETPFTDKKSYFQGVRILVSAFIGLVHTIKRKLKKGVIKMGIIAWIIFGALAGWIGSMIMGTDARQGAIGNIIVGIIGAFIGGFVMSLFGKSGVSGFNIYSMIVAVVGACIALGIYRAMGGRSHSAV